MKTQYLKLLLSGSFLMFFFTISTEAQIGRFALSPIQKIEQKIGFTDITIVYSRPSMRGRIIFGDLVPYDKFWRTGANRNTTIEFSEEVKLGGQTVKKGKYAVFTIPSRSEWEILLYDDTSNWDVPEQVDESKIVARTKVKANNKAKRSENLTIAVDNFDNYNFELIIKWEETIVQIPFELNNRALMEKAISKTLSGPSSGNYYSAATYELESGHDYKRGLEFINKSIEMNEEVSWWDYRMQANFLKLLGRKDEAKKVALKGLKMATEEQSEYGQKEFGIILQGL